MQIYFYVSRDYFVNVPSQWETMLHCKIASHWLGAYTKWSLFSLISSTCQVLKWFSEKGKNLPCTCMVFIVLSIRQMNKIWHQVRSVRVYQTSCGINMMFADEVATSEWLAYHQSWYCSWHYKSGKYPNKRPGSLGSSAAILTNEMSNKYFIRWMSGASFMKVRW